MPIRTPFRGPFIIAFIAFLTAAFMIGDYYIATPIPIWPISHTFLTFGVLIRGLAVAAPIPINNLFAQPTPKTEAALLYYILPGIMATRVKNMALTFVPSAAYKFTECCMAYCLYQARIHLTKLQLPEDDGRFRVKKIGAIEWQ